MAALLVMLEVTVCIIFHHTMPRRNARIRAREAAAPVLPELIFP